MIFVSHFLNTELLQTSRPYYDQYLSINFLKVYILACRSDFLW